MHASHDLPEVLLVLAGVQIATKQIDEGVKAAHMAAEAGADWVDLNCGCPIYGKASVSPPLNIWTQVALLTPSWHDTEAFWNTFGAGGAYVLHTVAHIADQLQCCAQPMCYRGSTGRSGSREGGQKL